MRRSCAWRRLLLGAGCALAAAHAVAQPGFELQATAADLAHYFPAYLANGYFATLSAPRGTEPVPSFIAGFMDYTPGDISRPAAIPGWAAVDFSSAPPGLGQGWLNHAPLDEQHFRDYRQTLDLHSATLTTRYRYVDQGRATALEVTTFVSQASPHLAVTRLTLTPDYSGTVHLSFPLFIWAPHEPRFALARMNGPEVEEALAANGLALQASAPATPDRAALWYPGFTAVHEPQGDVSSLSLWLQGVAQQGAPMALAAAVSLPQGTTPAAAAVRRDAYQITLDLSVPVVAGHAYSFAKYVAVSRADWGGDAQADLELARAARTRGFAALEAEHAAAWDRLWQADIRIEGDERAQQVAHSELYYLLASTAPGSSWGVGPCGLTLCYAGHVFWDSDTWMFPALLLLQPQRARSLVDFRARTLQPAQERARARGFSGAMYPWESDPESGTEQTPHSAYVLGETEIHVNADVAIAQWQYYLATHDREWLRHSGWPVIREVARFWASRASYDAGRGRYDILHVNSVAESRTDIPNDTFTNVSARKALQLAVAAARAVGERPDPKWSLIAARLYVPVAADGTHHVPFDPHSDGFSADFGDGPLALLFLPSLDADREPALLKGDWTAIRAGSLARVGATSMAIAPHTIAAAAMGDPQEAARWFAMNFSGGTLRPPFNVRTESADNNVGYFMTGSGGYLQCLIYGFTGLRIREEGLVAARPPMLPEGWRSLTLRNVRLRGQRLDIRVSRDAAGAVTLTREPR